MTLIWALLQARIGTPVVCKGKEILKKKKKNQMSALAMLS